MSIKNYQTLRRWKRAQFMAAGLSAGLTRAQIEEVIDSDINVIPAGWQKDAADAAANTNTTATHFFNNKTGRQLEVKEVEFTPDSTLTANDTNYVTITVEREDGAAGGKETVAEVTSKITGGSGNWATGVAEALTITAANKLLDPDAVLSIKMVKSGAGVAVPPGHLDVVLAEYADEA